MVINAYIEEIDKKFYIYESQRFVNRSFQTPLVQCSFLAQLLHWDISGFPHMNCFHYITRVLRSGLCFGHSKKFILIFYNYSLIKKHKMYE